MSLNKLAYIDTTYPQLVGRMERKRSTYIHRSQRFHRLRNVVRGAEIYEDTATAFRACPGTSTQ